MKKSRTVIVCLIIMSLLAGTISYTAQAATSTSGVTSDSIKEKEDQIAEMEKSKKDLQKNLTNLQKVKKDLEAQRSNLKNYVAQLDKQLVEIEENIETLKQQIADKEQEIKETQQELETAQEAEAKQQKDMISRIRLMYESQNGQWADILVSSGSFGNFLSKADSIEKVAAYDKHKYEDYKASRQYVELCKAQLELEKEILDETKAGVEQEQANLEDLIDQKNKDITAYETDINNKSKAIAEYEQMVKEQDSEIAALEAAILAEKKAILGENGDVISYDGGTFKFPLKTYTRISDDYGMRIHPTLGVEKFHNGVDFAAPKGTPIYAAYDGKVIAATYSATMGNYVMIDHGDELYTIYMHASALYVKSGDIVVRGETIAAVGTTGRSTGNHLHFSVRKNGSYVSPWNYISK